MSLKKHHETRCCLRKTPFSMVGMLVPIKGGIGSIFHPPGSARTISGIYWVVPPPSNSGNEGLGWDSLLKME